MTRSSTGYQEILDAIARVVPTVTDGVDMLDALALEIIALLESELPQTQAMLDQITAIGENQNGVMFLFCLHCTLQTVRRSIAHLPHSADLEAAIAALAKNYAQQSV